MSVELLICIFPFGNVLITCCGLIIINKDFISGMYLNIFILLDLSFVSFLCYCSIVFVVILEDNEERSFIDPISKDDPKLKELIQVSTRIANSFSTSLHLRCKCVHKLLFA